MSLIEDWSLEALIWLFPFVFILHDFEEIIMMESWIKRNHTRLARIIPPKILAMRPTDITTAQFSVGVIWIFAILSAITFYTVSTLSDTGNFLGFLAALHIFFLNVFTHLGQTILLRRYTPGVVTAIVFVLPYCLITYTRLFQEGISWPMIWSSLPISILLLPVIFLGLFLGTRLSFLK